MLFLYKYEMRAGFFTGDVGDLHAGPGKESRLVITANDLTTLQQTFSLNGNDYLSLPSMQEAYDGVRYCEAAGEKEVGSPDADSVLLNDLLTKSSPDSLAKPAFVSVPAHAFRNFEDGRPGSRMLAKWNLSYFDKNVSLARPECNLSYI